VRIPDYLWQPAPLIALPVAIAFGCVLWLNERVWLWRATRQAKRERKAASS
jgi:hypothetical protein